MADFLTRLAGRTLGLAATIQPIIAPMYAPGQQYVGAEDAQEGIRDAWGAINRDMGATNRGTTINRAPTTGYDRREMCLQDGSANEPSPGNLVGQTVDVQHDGRGKPPHPTSTPPPPLREEFNMEDNERDKPPHPPSTTPLGEESNVEHDGRRKRPYPRSTPPVDEESEVRHDERHKRPHPASTPLPPLRESQGSPLETILAPPVVDVLSALRPAEPKAIRPQRDINQVRHLGHSYNQGNEHEVAPVTQKSSAPAPTIQVTIGRIEVRATPPPAPHSQPKRSGPPVMGLEEYLNQRAKGGY